MQFKSFLLAAAVVGAAVAQDLDDSNDVPSECLSVCTPVITVGLQCNEQFDEDGPVLDCICSADGMRAAIPECEACVVPYLEQNDGYDG